MSRAPRVQTARENIITEYNARTAAAAAAKTIGAIRADGSVGEIN